MDLRGHTASLNGVDLELTPAEFQLLSQFMAEPERAFTRLELLEATQGGAMRDMSGQLICISRICVKS
jgi:DNA-binding response OmpR family regulator